MAKPEYYYGVHSVESLLELEPERVLTLFTLKGRDDQRLQTVFWNWLNRLALVCKKPAVTAWKNWPVYPFIRVWWLPFVHIQS